MPRRQLISYIAPGAPATRRLADGDEPLLRPEIGFAPQWYREALGIDFGQRWHVDVRYRRETVIAMRHELQRRFPGAKIGGAEHDDVPLDLLTGVFGTCIVAAIFGLPIVYTANNWPNVEHRYLTRAQMAALEVPDLVANPMFQDLLRQVEEIERMQEQAVGFINWQGVLNNAQRLRGPDLFVDLYEAPQLVRHFFEVICETMLLGIHGLHERQRAGGIDYQFATISNCSVNLISPLQYEEFALPYDRRIASEFDMIGIHNCAWNADPYVPLYATIPNLAYVDMGLNSNLEKARRLLPGPRRALMYTPMDLANKSMDAIYEDLEQAARNYAPCDIVLADIESGTPDECVLGVIGCCEELSKRGTV